MIRILLCVIAAMGIVIGLGFWNMQTIEAKNDSLTEDLIAEQLITNQLSQANVNLKNTVASLERQAYDLTVIIATNRKKINGKQSVNGTLKNQIRGLLNEVDEITELLHYCRG